MREKGQRYGKVQRSQSATFRFFFVVDLAFNNTIFKDEYNIVECKQSDHHGVTRDP